ncbi:MAG: cell division topological specificity factor MinE [Eubacterium sp.]
MSRFTYFHKRNSGNIAKTRLKSLLVSDRTNCNPDTIKILRDEINYVISKHFSLEENETDVILKKAEDNSYFLQINIPVKEVNQK